MNRQTSTLTLVMLILKKNILKLDSDLPMSSPEEKEYPPGFNPYDLLEATLREEKAQICILLKQPSQFWEEDSQRFYPNAYKSGDLKIIKSFIEILLEGLTLKTRWFHMNTYHFCILYDILFRYTFNYNHDEKN